MDPYVKLIIETPRYRDEIVAFFEEAGDPLAPPLTRQAVYGWKKLKKGVPRDRAKGVSKIIGVPLYKLRPDIFGRPSKPPQKNGQVSR